MTNTIRLKITCFLLLFTVLLIKDILDLAWHLATRMKFGTCEQNWDLYGTISGLWSQLGPSPKFGTSLRALFLLFGFFLFRDQIFRNRDFFPRPNFFETETETFFPKPNFPKPKPSKIWQKFRNREVSKPKCQSLAICRPNLGSGASEGDPRPNCCPNYTQKNNVYLHEDLPPEERLFWKRLTVCG